MAIQQSIYSGWTCYGYLMLNLGMMMKCGSFEKFQHFHHEIAHLLIDHWWTHSLRSSQGWGISLSCQPTYKFDLVHLSRDGTFLSVVNVEGCLIPRCYVSPSCATRKRLWPPASVNVKESSYYDDIFSYRNLSHLLSHVMQLHNSLIPTLQNANKVLKGYN